MSVFINKTKKRPVIETDREVVEKYWDYELNDKEGLFPTKLTRGSNKKVHLHCKKCGAKWNDYMVADITIYNLKCPYCARSKGTKRV